MATIRIAAALIVRQNRDTLLVRKRGTTTFMQPGGKIEPGESPLQALARELKEEINLDIDPEAALFLGRFDAIAANEPDHVVEAELFRVYTDEIIQPAAEIEEVAWMSVLKLTDIPMAPLTEHLILPFYRQSLSANQA